MNLAFPALVVFVLVLPGFILRYTYTSGFWGWSSPTSMRRVSDEVAYAVIFALLIHVVWLGAVELLGNKPDLHTVLARLSGNFGRNEERLEQGFAAIAGQRISPLIAMGASIPWYSLMLTAACCQMTARPTKFWMEKWSRAEAPAQGTIRFWETISC